MKVLITGSAGFIGYNFAKSLLEKKEFKVLGIDNFNDYYLPKDKERNISKCLKNKNFKLYKADICDFKLLKKIFEKESPKKISLLIIFS